MRGQSASADATACSWDDSIDAASNQDEDSVNASVQGEVFHSQSGGTMRYKAFVVGCSFLLSATASASDSVSQPYRAVNETRQWTIEGRTYGLMKVRVTINGQVVAEGPMTNANFSSTYSDRPVRVTCSVGRLRLSTGSDQSCSVYVEDELAANLVFVRNQ